MALTPAEKQRAYRERRKEEAEAAADEAAVAPRGAFAAYIGNEPTGDELTFIADTLDSVGLAFPDLSVDEDPDWRSEWTTHGGAVENGSLGKAERMVGALIDSADALARIINRFKLREIDTALARAAQADMTDPAVKAATVAELMRLEGLKAQLGKQVRRSFPATQIRGGAATI